MITYLNSNLFNVVETGFVNAGGIEWEKRIYSNGDKEAWASKSANIPSGGYDIAFTLPFTANSSDYIVLFTPTYYAGTNVANGFNKVQGTVMAQTTTSFKIHFWNDYSTYVGINYHVLVKIKTRVSA